MTRQQTQYESPEMELLQIATLQTLAQSVTEPSGEADDFGWGSFDD